VENSSLLPPVGVWAVLNPSVAAHPLRPATDRSLGEPLPHQPANRTQAHPLAPLVLRPEALLALSLHSAKVCGLVADFSAVFLTGG
jgi:hypothetical protein